MRPTGITPPIPISAWQRKPNRSAVLRRIQNLTQELEAIQAEVHGQLAGPVAGKPSSFFEDAAAMQVLNRFKAELDQLRRILWFYIEEASEQSLSGTDQEQAPHPENAKRMLSPALQPCSAVPDRETAWFFDRLNLVIDSYIQEKRPATAETKSPQRSDIKAFS